MQLNRYVGRGEDVDEIVLPIPPMSALRLSIGHCHAQGTNRLEPKFVQDKVARYEWYKRTD